MQIVCIGQFDVNVLALMLVLGYKVYALCLHYGCISVN